MFVVVGGLEPTRSARPEERQPKDQRAKHGVKLLVRAASLLPTCLNGIRGGTHGANIIF